MWLWGLSEVALYGQSPLEWDTNVESFIDRIQDENSVIYFHNLKYDGAFIIDYLLKHAFRVVYTNRNMPSGSVYPMISGMNKFFKIEVKWFNGKKTEFRDSLKKLPMTVARIAQSFNMDEGKGDIDYHADRPVGYQPTPEELDYLRRDISIVANALQIAFNTGMTRLTVASDSMAEYKSLVGQQFFDKMFPNVGDACDREIRKAYRGGFTYLADRYRARVLGSGLVLDVNSLYPHVMYSAALPYGVPRHFDGMWIPAHDGELAIMQISLTAKVKDDHVPCIQIKGSSIFGGVEYLKEITEPETMYMTNVDLALYQEQYDIEIHAYLGGWAFRSTNGMFDKYIDKWSKVKAESKGGVREIAKLHLNSLYGKFASNPNVTGKFPYLEDERVKYESGPDETRAPVYTAVGVFITSYARALTIRAAQENYDVFAYADTDSLHLLTDTVPETIDVHPTRMGAWKLEYHFTSAFFARPKAYIERKADGTNKVAWAGLPSSVSDTLTFDDMRDGNVIMGKLVPRSVPGGVVLVDSPYRISL